MCRFDELTVRAGLTDPKEILAYLRQGAEVHAVSNLHAKVFVFGRSAIIGSYNLSSHSERSLLEAAVEISSPSLVRSCREFVESLRGDEVGPEYARRLAALYRPPKIDGISTKPRGPRRVRQGDLVAAALEYIDFDDEDDAAEKAAKHIGRARLADPDRFTVVTFKWEGQLPSTIRRGVRVLQIFREGSRRDVYPPARVLEVRRYASRRGARRAMVCVEAPKRVRPRGLSEVLTRLGPRARLLRGLKRTRRIGDPAALYDMGRLWLTLRNRSK